jgi:hypothetical protein
MQGAATDGWIKGSTPASSIRCSATVSAAVFRTPGVWRIVSHGARIIKIRAVLCHMTYAVLLEGHLALRRWESILLSRTPERFVTREFSDQRHEVRLALGAPFFQRR